jgi:hypothetical protein
MIALLALASCRSTAPHTLGAAAINTALATGAAAAIRAEGGCYAICTNGTACNPRTGMCERGDSENLVDTAVREDGRLTLKLREQQAGRAATPTVIGVGISPATGTAPPPPAESSPRSP